MTATLTGAAKTQSATSYLYTMLATSHLGETAAIVISSLISHGRSTAKEISTRSRLELREVRSALVSLIQLNCIQHWHDSPDSPTYYTFHEYGMQVLLYGGDIIAHIKTIYGQAEAEAMQNIISNGSITVKDYLGSFTDEQVRLDQSTMLLRLFSDGWLRRLQAVDFQPVDDVWLKLYQETLKNTPRSATTSEVKRVAEAKEKSKVKTASLFASGNDLKDCLHMENGIHQLRPNIIVAFNLSRYEKALRSRALVGLADSRLGLITSQIYAACCTLIEQPSPDLHHCFLSISGLITDPEEKQMFLRSIENRLVDNKSTVFTIRDVVRALPKNLDLTNSILTQNFLKPGKRVGGAFDGGHVQKKIKLEDNFGSLENGTIGSPEPSDDEEASGELHPQSLVAEHLRLLCSSSLAFLLEVSPGSYTIPFLQLSKHVKQHNYDALVKTTLGVNAHRILRCIKAMKLVDEKAISNSVLLKEKTVKNEVYKLVTNNVIEIQEVPRSADRAASKTFYLFRHKEFTSYRFLASSLLHAMGEILSNIQRFKLDHKILLDKCEREDVKGHEEELLLDAELKTLNQLKIREVNNIGRFNRIKWLHFIFGVL